MNTHWSMTQPSSSTWPNFIVSWFKKGRWTGVAVTRLTVWSDLTWHFHIHSWIPSRCVMNIAHRSIRIPIRAQPQQRAIGASLAPPTGLYFVWQIQLPRLKGNCAVESLYRLIGSTCPWINPNCFDRYRLRNNRLFNAKRSPMHCSDSGTSYLIQRWSKSRTHESH